MNDKALDGAQNQNIPSLNRREFLAIVPAMAAVSATGLGAETAAKTIPVGAHPDVYSQHRDELRQDVPLIEQIFSDMSYAGLDGIELFGAGDLYAKGGAARIRELMKKYNLPVIGMSYSGPMWDRERHAAMIEQGARTSGDWRRCMDTLWESRSAQPKPRKRPSSWDVQADFLRKLFEICKSNGVKPNLHNHTYEVKDNEYDLKGTLRVFRTRSLGRIWTGWSPAASIRWISSGATRIESFLRTLRDRKSDGKWPEAMGEGNLDYSAYGRALRDVGFSGDLVIELAHPGNFKLTRPLRESLKMSREYVRRVMGY